MSVAKIDIPLSDHHKEKISKYKTGFKFNEESKQKMRASHLIYNYNKRKQNRRNKMSTEKYDNMVTDLKYNSNLMIGLAEESANGTKSLALTTRKMSMQLTQMLKEFRVLSIANDKEK